MRDARMWCGSVDWYRIDNDNRTSRFPEIVIMHDLIGNHKQDI